VAIKTGPFVDIYKINELLGLHKRNDSAYCGTYATGAFEELHDYGAGLLQVHISATVASLKLPQTFTVHFGLSTIDDGGWQAWDGRCDYTEEEAVARLKEIAEAFDKFMDGSTTLPTERELNAFLMPLKLWGICTG
jgi:hypothetical protein